MARIINIGGVNHIVVTPSAPFMNSSLIKSVLGSKRQIVVNLNTGLMSIHKPEPEKACMLEIDGTKRKLANDREVALLQAEDYLHGNPNLSKMNVRFFIESEGKYLYLTSLNKTDVHEFLRQVSYAYRKFI